MPRLIVQFLASILLAAYDRFRCEPSMRGVQSTGAPERRTE